MSSVKILKRRDGTNFRYSLTYLDSASVAILEIDEGDPNDPYAKREPTRRVAVANVAHIDELQDWCDEWNKANEDTQAEWPESVLINPPE